MKKTDLLTSTLYYMYVINVYNYKQKGLLSATYSRNTYVVSLIACLTVTFGIPCAQNWRAFDSLKRSLAITRKILNNKF